MTLTEMRHILAVGNIQLTKSLGQNFLHDANQIRRIVSAAELEKTDCVIEIGPGLGPLTEILVQEAGKVLAIEKDVRLVRVLAQRFGVEPQKAPRASKVTQEDDNAPVSPGQVHQEKRNPKKEQLESFPSVRTRSTVSPISCPNVGDAVERVPTVEGLDLGPQVLQSHDSGTPVLKDQRLCLHHDDALEFFRREPRDWSNWKSVSNLPYSVASSILVEFARSEHGPKRVVATLQIEVAKRLMASAGENDYGVLALLTRLTYEPTGWFKIPASCFFPEPDVDSACICLERRPEPLLTRAQSASFIKIVKRSFSQRRKMMLKLLKADWPLEALKEAFAQAQIDATVRAEMLTLDQFVTLARCLS